MTTTRSEVHPPRSHGPSSADHEASDGRAVGRGRLPRALTATLMPAAISPVRKAAIVLVSLDQSLASQLLSHLDRSAVEAVTWEIARLDRVDPADRAAVLEEFYGLGLRRLCFVFDDLVKMADGDLRAAFHEEDHRDLVAGLGGRGRSGAGQGDWRPFPPRRQAGCAIILTASARSGCLIPKQPSSRSPSGSAGCTITAASACRSRADATKFSSK